MQLWILSPDLEYEDGEHWSQWFEDYDIAVGFAIRAETEQQARQLAAATRPDQTRRPVNPWLSAEMTICRPLPAEGEAEIILQDYKAG